MTEPDVDVEAAIRKAGSKNSSKFLTTRELAGVLGISESSVKRWADSGHVDVARTIGGHRRIPVEAAIRFARESGMLAARTERAKVSPQSETDAGRLTERLYENLMSGDADGARRLMLAEFRAGRTAAEICDGPIRAAMVRIGELWRGDEAEGVFIEHRATDISLDILRRLRAHLDATHARRPLAIGCAPERDIYSLPTLASSVVLFECGYATVNLGPATPMRVLHRAVQDQRPRIAWLAMNVEPGEQQTQELVTGAQEVAASLAQWGGFLVAGGRNVPSGMRDLQGTANLRFFSTMAELATFAESAKAQGEIR